MSSNVKTPDIVFQMCKEAQKEAIGKIQVGAVCHGMKIVDGEPVNKYWSGANLHVSDSFADIHAEQMAVNLCLLEGYYPVEIYVTSQSEEEDVVMCGSCRQYINEINQDCIIIVFNPSGSLKHSPALLSTVYPYSKNSSEKNKKFRLKSGYPE